MITPQIKNKIIEYLGQQYTGAIIKHLIDNQIYNSVGNPYSSNSITNFVNGYQSNYDVTNAILELLETKKKEAKKRLKKLEKL